MVVSQLLHLCPLLLLTSEQLLFHRCTAPDVTNSCPSRVTWWTLHYCREHGCRSLLYIFLDNIVLKGQNAKQEGLTWGRRGSTNLVQAGSGREGH